MGTLRMRSVLSYNGRGVFGGTRGRGSVWRNGVYQLAIGLKTLVVKERKVKIKTGDICWI